MLVTALEANSEVPKMELVTARILHEERKIQNRQSDNFEKERLMMAKSKQKYKPEVGPFLLFL